MKVSLAGSLGATARKGVRVTFYSAKSQMNLIIAVKVQVFSPPIGVFATQTAPQADKMSFGGTRYLPKI